MIKLEKAETYIERLYCDECSAEMVMDMEWSEIAHLVNPTPSTRYKYDCPKCDYHYICPKSYPSIVYK